MKKHPPRRPRLLLLPVLVLVLWGAGAAPSALAQQPPEPSNGGASGGPGIVQSWAVSPGDGTAATAGRPNLSYELAPGSDATDVITVYNLSNVAMTFTLYSTDAFNASDGSLALLPGDQKPSDVGTWVELPAPGVSLEAGTQATMPIKIHVPADARPGDHAGAILASSSLPGTGPDGKVVNIDRRTGTRVYVRVAGPLQPKLTVEDLETTYKSALNPMGGSAEVSYKIVNRGNVRLSGTQQVSVSGPFGLFGKSLAAEDVPELLPGQSVDVTKKLTDVTASGLLETHVDVQPRGVTNDNVPLPKTTRSSYGLAIPLLLVAALIIALLAWITRRSYLRHRDEEVVVDRERDRDRETAGV